MPNCSCSGMRTRCCAGTPGWRRGSTIRASGAGGGARRRSRAWSGWRGRIRCGDIAGFRASWPSSVLLWRCPPCGRPCALRASTRHRAGPTWRQFQHAQATGTLGGLDSAAGPQPRPCPWRAVRGHQVLIRDHCGSGVVILFFSQNPGTSHDRPALHARPARNSGSLPSRIVASAAYQAVPEQADHEH
jgi:hypothetical protein